MSPSALGATRDGESVLFAVRSLHATAVEVCLYSSDDPRRETGRTALERGDGGLWSAVVPGVAPGAAYGFRVDGPRVAESGHRFNPEKLLMDPYARALTGDVRWSDELRWSSPGDSAPYVPRCLVDGGVDGGPDDGGRGGERAFHWGDDAPPRTDWADTVLYECHVRGMTRLHPEVPRELRGTYLGLAEEPVLEHLRGLGVTAVELMPVQHFASEPHLARAGLTNYWGYSPLSFFAPHEGYATGAGGRQVTEFKAMVRALHAAGLEVVLDVVFNHTVEGDEEGPVLSLRGIDNASYYRTRPDDPSRYVDFTGCGNTLNAASPWVRQLVLDSLRYWVEEMHVDGFRFDLATVLGRGDPDFSTRAPLFEEMALCPVLSRVKRIAEPWDLGPGGYRLGGFPEPWREWNDRYRDSLRRFWRGDEGVARELATRLAGSSDLYASRSTGASTGIHYVTCHDGFTLEDLVSYEEKRNAANLEQNRDGRGDNLSRNWGVEGDTDDPEILHARQRAKKNLLASLALSVGVPMLSHGDELGRTQKGNNNAYCQDSAVTWVDWDLDARERELLRFTRKAFRVRRRLGLLRRPELFASTAIRWLDADGEELSADSWGAPELRELAMLIDEPGAACGGFLLLANARARPVVFRLPRAACGHSWAAWLATAPSAGDEIGAALELPGYSLSALGCAGEVGSAPAAAPPAGVSG